MMKKLILGTLAGVILTASVSAMHEGYSQITDAIFERRAQPVWCNRPEQLGRTLVQKLAKLVYDLEEQQTQQQEDKLNYAYDEQTYANEKPCEGLFILYEPQEWHALQQRDKPNHGAYTYGHTYAYASGNGYRGEIRDGERHGYGEMRYANGKLCKGDWEHNKLNGWGIKQWIGQEYKGSFKGGKRHGYGEMRCGNGEFYKGIWRNDQKHGEGTYTYADARLCRGEWQHDELNGWGLKQWMEGEYEGSFERGKRHGYGEMTYPSGDFYEGNWQNDQKHGEGTYTCANGKQCKGEFAFGKVNLIHNGVGTTCCDMQGQRITLTDAFDQEGRLKEGVIVFEGEIKEKQRTGLQVVTMPAKYEGQGQAARLQVAIAFEEDQPKGDVYLLTGEVVKSVESVISLADFEKLLAGDYKGLLAEGKLKGAATTAGLRYSVQEGSDVLGAEAIQ